MDFFQTITEFEIAGNKLWRIIALFGVILISLVVGKIVKMILQNSAKRFESRKHIIATTTLNALARGIVFLFGVAGIYMGLSVLKMDSRIADISFTLTSILFTIALGFIVYWLIDVPNLWLANFAAKTESKLDDMLVPIIRKSLRVTLVILILVQIAQILSDKPITSIIAGLGIGGLAVALAAQDTIRNFFGSILLFFDKPFEIGDRIVIEGHDGPVEEVGLRSTKIRTLDGHLVTIPNGALVNKNIQNVGKRPYIRRVANITITYDTPPEKIDRALEILKEILNNHEGMNENFPPRVYFNDFNSASLNILVIYWYHPPAYWDYIAFTERFNKEVLRRFNEEGIEFAFPTQTLYLARDPSRPFTFGIRNNR